MASSSSSSSSSSPLSSPATSPSPIQYSLQNPTTQDVFQSIVNGRKSWKTLKGGEVVWPPELEAALIQGLENYRPEDTRETRLLGRFPMRNKFISDWILEKTGKRRTAKQVGSRLQQLRDSCGGKRILSLLSPFQHPYRSSPTSPSSKSHHGDSLRRRKCESDSGSDSSSSSASAPATPIEPHATLQSLLYRGVESRAEELPSNIIYIDLLRPGSSSVNDNDEPTWTSPIQLAEERSFAERGYRIIRASQQPRLLCDIDPTITFLAPSMTNACSYFTVYLEDRVVFSESTTLEVVESTTNVDGILYKTSLVPGFWDTISKSSDASQYTITQHVVQDASESCTPPTIFSAMFKFLYQTSTPTIENFAIAAHMLSTTTTPFEQNDGAGSLSVETLLTMEDAYTEMMALDTNTATKSPDFFGWDFTNMSPDWSGGQCSPDPSVFSSPTSQLLMPSSDEDRMLLLSPASSFGIDIANYL